MLNLTRTCIIEKVLIPANTQITHAVNRTICRTFYTFTYFRLFWDYLVFGIIFHIMDNWNSYFFLSIIISEIYFQVLHIQQVDNL